MEFKELTTVKFLGISNVKHSILWSEDDKIAVVTQKGVNILDLCLSRKNSSSELDYIRSLIVPPSTYPTYETGIKTDEVFIRAEREQVFNMMMDPLLYSGLKLTENQPALPLQAVWSKAGMADAKGCLLATRQSTGSVVIYLCKKSSWKEEINISQIWLRHLKESVWPQEKSAGRDIHTILNTRVNQIEATGITWSQVVTEEGCCWSLLFVAHRDGSIIAWKVKREGEGSSSTNVCSLSFQLNMTGMGRITHISWHSHGSNTGLLIVGDIRGVAKSVLFTDLSSAADTAHEAQEVWGDKDMIAVSGAVASGESGVWLLVVAKGSCLVALAMSHTGTQLAKTIANLGTLDISGMISQSENTMMLVTQCGTINKIELSFSAEVQELELECLEMPSKFDTSHYFLQGLSTSRNKLIFAASQTVSAPYDHLALREPTQVVFFTYSTFECAWGFLNKQQPLHSLYECWDYLELIRILGQSVSWDLDLRALDIRSNKNPNLAWWIVILKQMETKSEGDGDDLIQIQQKLEDKILCHHIIKVLSRLKGKSLESLLSEERNSAALLRHWLHDYAQTSEGKKLITPELLEDITTQGTAVEQCHICSNEVKFVSSRVASCESGHVLPRCSLTLLPCSSVPLRSCHTCSLVALQHPGFGLEPKCVYCCRPLDLDEYF